MDTDFVADFEKWLNGEGPAPYDVVESATEEYVPAAVTEEPVQLQYVLTPRERLNSTRREELATRTIQIPHGPEV